MDICGYEVAQCWMRTALSFIGVVVVFCICVGVTDK